MGTVMDFSRHTSPLGFDEKGLGMLASLLKNNVTTQAHKPSPFCGTLKLRVGSADLLAVRQGKSLPGLPHSQATHRVACFVSGRL
jgi:hypothetical protein